MLSNNLVRKHLAIVEYKYSRVSPSIIEKVINTLRHHQHISLISTSAYCSTTQIVSINSFTFFRYKARKFLIQSHVLTEPQALYIHYGLVPDLRSSCHPRQGFLPERVRQQ